MITRILFGTHPSQTQPPPKSPYSWADFPPPPRRPTDNIYGDEPPVYKSPKRQDTGDSGFSFELSKRGTDISEFSFSKGPSSGESRVDSYKERQEAALQKQIDIQAKRRANAEKPDLSATVRPNTLHRSNAITSYRQNTGLNDDPVPWQERVEQGLEAGRRDREEKEAGEQANRELFTPEKTEFTLDRSGTGGLRPIKDLSPRAEERHSPIKRLLEDPFTKLKRGFSREKKQT